MDGDETSRKRRWLFLTIGLGVMIVSTAFWIKYSLGNDPEEESRAKCVFWIIALVLMKVLCCGRPRIREGARQRIFLDEPWHDNFTESFLRQRAEPNFRLNAATETTPLCVEVRQEGYDGRDVSLQPEESEGRGRRRSGQTIYRVP